MEVGILHFDNEFLHNAMKDYCDQEGILKEPSVPYAHHQNGVAERVNRTARERSAALIQDQHPPSPITRAITNRAEEYLHHATLPQAFWTYAIQEAIWKKNRAPTRAHKNKLTPYEALFGVKPNLKREHPWGARVYVAYAPELRGLKLHAPRGWVGYFLTAESETICRVYNPETKHIKRVAIVRVDDNAGMDDPQPGIHISERAPLPHVDPPPDEWDPSDEGSDVTDPDQDQDAYVEHEHNDGHIHPPDGEHVAMMATPLEAGEQAPSSPSEEHERSAQRAKVRKLDLNKSANINRDHRRRIKRDYRKPILDKGPAQGPSPLTSPHFPVPPIKRIQWSGAEQVVWNTASDSTLLADTEGSSQNPISISDAAHAISSEDEGMDNDVPDDDLLHAEQQANYESTLEATLGSQFSDIVYETDYEHDKEDNIEPPPSGQGDTIVHDTDFEDDTEENDKCRCCLYMGRSCIKEFGQSKCNTCHERRAKCTLPTPEEIRNHAQRCSNCNQRKNALTCNGSHPCNHCTGTDKELTCKPKESRKHLPKLDVQDRCGRCQLSPYGGKHRLETVFCDGNFPCNVCVTNGRDCIRKEHIEREACNGCRAKKRDCNLEDYCSQCDKINVACGHYLDNTTYVLHYKDKDSLDNNGKFHIPDDKLNSCNRCHDIGRECSGHLPCKLCVEKFLNSSNHRKVCFQRTGPTTMTGKLVDAYEINYVDEDEGIYTIDLKTNYAGPGIARVMKSLAKDDFVDLAMMATLHIDDTEHAEYVIDDRLDGDVLDMLDVCDPELDDDLLAFSATTPSAILDIRTPKSYKEAMKTPEAEHWDKAVWKEVDSLNNKGVFKVVKITKGQKTLPAKIVFKLKLTPAGNIEKYKARIVAGGHRQKEGIDYDQKFAPTVRSESVRIVIAITVLLGWIRTQVDIPTAYLNAPLPDKDSRPVYVRPPHPIELGKDEAWLMLMALYGLVQSGRAWYFRLMDDAINLGFRASRFDPCVYVHEHRPIILCIHVDDIGISAATQEHIDWLKGELHLLFNIDMSEPDATYLGMHVIQKGDTIVIHQSGYVNQLLHRFNLEEHPIIRTPGDHRIKLETNKDAAAPHFKIAYLQRFGSANFLPTNTRPELAHQVSTCGRYNSNPSQQHMDAITQVLGYLKGREDHGITYTKMHDTSVTGFSDADWAGCQDGRRSTSGWVFIMAGAPVSWCSNRQSVVALSTCEAEYMALSAAAQEAVWIKNFINDLGVGIQLDHIPIHVDNESAIRLTMNPEFHKRSKHIDIRHHYIRECVKKGDVRVHWISGKENPADMFTKTLPPHTFDRMCELLGLRGKAAAIPQPDLAVETAALCLFCHGGQ
jgi:hypothetical protein